MSEPDYDFLNEEAPDDVVPQETAAPEPDAVTVDVTPDVPAPVVTTTPEPAEERVPMAAVIAERRKRQELERRIAEYERAQQPAQPQSFYEAPDEFVNQVEARATQRLHAALEAQAREVYQDYDEVFNELNEYAQDNPACVPQIMNSPNPALAAYKFGKQLRELKEMQDPAAYRQKIEAEVRTKLEAEYLARDEAKRKAAEAVPPDLSAVRSSRDSEVIADDSLDSILQGRKK